MSILEYCRPRKDLLAGTLNPEIFTANLMQVIDHYRGETDVVQNLYTDAPVVGIAGDRVAIQRC
ncbi:hypothetical protein THIOKS12260005 [Thiocapsa sp. KS1]|nr:hypothetical protein [Thiocapsa sp. KS1]CRI65191.1 hypothetical protein THIOKS12260005 [Thiocapsa sp. KS1]